MEKEKELDKKKLTEEATDEKCDKCSSPMVIKLGRFGKFMACSNYPECKNTKPINENGEPEKPETTDEKCPECGKPMIFKHGRFGKFLACSDYPKCKTTKAVAKGTGVTCTKCNEGEMQERRTKRGRIFYGCNKYPDCEHAVWSKPTGDTCPECKQLLLYAKKDFVKCEACDYTKQVDPAKLTED